MDTHQKGFMDTLEYYFVTKAPFQIPSNLKELIVKFGPWLNVLFVVSFLPLVSALVGFGAIFSRYSYMYMAAGWSLYSILSLATFVLTLLAIPGLFKRNINGWNMLFYAQVVSFIANIMYGNLIGGIISAIIGLYILFQIKSYYR